MICQQLLCVCQCAENLINHLFLINSWIDRSSFILGVIVQSLLQGFHNADIVNDETITLPGSDTVCSGDSLHQSVSLQRLVQIQAGKRLHIKACEPHGAYEHNAEVAICILKLFIKLTLLHLGTMWQNIQIPLFEGLDFILFLTDDDAHLCVLHPFQLARKLHLFLIGYRRRHFRYKALNLFLPVFLHIIVHANTGHLIQADEHSLASCPKIAVVTDKVLSNSTKAWLCCQQMHFLLKLMHDLLGLIRIQVRSFDSIQNLIGNIRILDILYLVATILIIERHGSFILNSSLEIVNRDIATEGTRRNLVGGKQGCAGKAYTGSCRQEPFNIVSIDAILTAVCLVRHDQDIVIRIDRRLVRLVEFLDKGDDKAWIAFQLFNKISSACGHELFTFGFSK